MKVVLIAALALRAIERQVGLSQHSIRIGNSGDKGTNPNAHRYARIVTVEIVRTVKFRLDPRRQFPGVGRFLDLALQYRELIATESCDEIGFAGATPQAPRDLLEQEIAGGMAE